MLNRPVLGLGKAGLLPPRRSNGTGPSVNTSHGTHDHNASPQNQRATSVTDSQPLVPPGNDNGNFNNHNNLTNLPQNMRSRNLHHAAASGVTGAPKESEIITIGSPHYKDDEGVGAASAELLVDIEEVSNEKTAAGTNTGAGTIAGIDEDEDKKETRGGKRKSRLGDKTDAPLSLAAAEEEEKEKEKEKPPREKRTRSKKTPSSATTPARKRRRTSLTAATTTTGTTTTTKTPSYKISDLIGQVVLVPGSVFSVLEPEYYIGDIKKRDNQHKNAVEVAFRDDNSRYWFPVKDVVRWLEEEKQRNNTTENVDILVEEEHEGKGEKEEETNEAPTTIAAEIENIDHGPSVLAGRKNSMFDEELAAQALTDISASGMGGGGLSGLSVTISASGGGGAAGGDVYGASSGKATAATRGVKRSSSPASAGTLGNLEKNDRGPSRLRNAAN